MPPGISPADSFQGGDPGKLDRLRCVAGETIKAQVPGIIASRLVTDSGAIAVTRPDGRVATLSLPGQPDRQSALSRWHGAELIAEELCRLEPDVYREAVQGGPDRRRLTVLRTEWDTAYVSPLRA